MVKYPDLDPTQKAIFMKLVESIATGPQQAIDKAFQEACYTIFAHNRTQYLSGRNADKFFSPVNALRRVRPPLGKAVPFVKLES